MCPLLVDIVKAFAASSNSITALAALFAAGCAFLGLKAWREQLKGSAEYTLAKDMLKAAYGVREAFIHVRNPFIRAYEYPENMRDPSGHLKDEFRAEGTGHVYEERFKVFSKAFRILEDKVLDAQVEWGDDYTTVMPPLRQCRVELMLALQSHIEAQKPNFQPRSTTKHEKEWERKSVMYNLGENSEQDLFTTQINAAIAGFEKRLRPIIGENRANKTMQARLTSGSV